MFGFKNLISIAAVLCSVASVQAKSVYPSTEALANSDLLKRSTPVSPSLTNAERFARGLPPLPPQKRHGDKDHDSHNGHHNPHPPKPSSVPGTKPKGYILVKKGGNTIGYVAQDTNVWGTYGVTDSKDDAVLVDLDVPTGTRVSQFDARNIIFDSSADAAYPNFGGVKGFFSTTNLGKNTPDYALLSATEPTPANSPAQSVANSWFNQPAESAIWSIDLRSGAITAQWVNSDSKKPRTYIAYSESDFNSLVLIGDYATFSSEYTGYDIVTFTFVSA